MNKVTAQPPPWWKDLHWENVTWFTMVHIVGLVGGVWYISVDSPVTFLGVSSSFAPETIVFSVIFFFLCHLSITCGAHRLWTHEAYHAIWQLQVALVLLFAAAIQGPLKKWVGHHRKHHAKPDQEGDPHSPRDGLFWSQMGWNCTRTGYASAGSRYSRHLDDFPNLPRIFLWQSKHYFLFGITTGIIFPGLICSLWGDALGGVLIGGFLRLNPQYHFTWIVNSFGHAVGERGKGGGLATNNIRAIRWILGILTVGEVYHANHHEFPGDYRLGRGFWNLDPGKWVIYVWARFGLAYNLKRPADRAQSALA